MLTIKNYKKAESLEEAFKLNQIKSNRIVGGMLWLKMGKGNINTAIDLSGLSLDRIEETEEEFRIGAMVTLRQLECCEGLLSYTRGAMKEALRHIVGVQFRNLATVGGSIYGRYGFSDVLTIFQVMDTYVELFEGGIIPLAQFAASAYTRDVLVRLIVKKHREERFAYQSVRNTQTDFPVLTCSASWQEESSQVRLSVGARPGRAVLLTDEKGILKEGLTEEAIETFAAYAAESIPTGSNLRGSAEYRSHLVKVLTGRILSEVSGQ